MKELDRHCPGHHPLPASTSTTSGCWGTLLTELCKLPFHWIRLHYLYPDDLDDALIDVIAREPKVLNYIDIPLQHINDGILKRMCRRSTKAEILALLAKLRDRLPGLVLRTSLICGLPGEGKAEFEELCHFCGAAHPAAGVFQFSPEEGPWPPPWRAKWTRTPPPGGWNWWWISNPGSWTSTMRSGWAP